MRRFLPFFLSLFFIFSAAACAPQTAKLPEASLSTVAVPVDTPKSTNAPKHIYTEEELTGSAGSLTWRIDVESETLYISGEGELPDYNRELRPPWVGLGVYRIGTTDDPRLFSTLVVEEGVTKLGAFAFGDLYLFDVKLPDSLQVIGENCFRACADDVFDIPKNVCVIGEMPFFWNDIAEFRVAEENEYFCAVDGVLYDKAVTRLVAYPTQRAGSSYALPDTVTHISSYAFAAWDCGTDLFVIALPEGLTSLGDFAFHRCFALQDPELPASLRDIGMGAFYMPCMDLLILPEGITALPYGAFDDSEMKQIVLPSTLTELHEGAFAGCQFDLEEIYFLGAPPAFERDEKTYTILHRREPFPVFYYPVQFASLWAPNGETEWNAYRIEPFDNLPEFTYRQADTLDEWWDIVYDW
ncbi:MAG: leucine-rich repeat domain-containing protein [Clostridiales bacterium]|nr:leucine-rich repeat domain-containing protein [Clostridiales bacterium]